VLGAHHVIGTTVSFTSDNSDLGYCSLSIGKQKFGTIPDDAIMLLVRAWKGVC
jgi:hypothetical protein